MLDAITQNKLMIKMDFINSAQSRPRVTRNRLPDVTAKKKEQSQTGAVVWIALDRPTVSLPCEFESTRGGRYTPDQVLPAMMVVRND